MSQVPHGSEQPEVEQALLEFLALRGHESNVDIETFAAGRPQIAEELRAKYEAWLELAPLLATGGDELVNASHLFDTRSLPGLEPSMELEVSLHETGAADDPTALIKKLSEHAERIRSQVGTPGKGEEGEWSITPVKTTT
jgi:hypothetical protein